MRKFNYSVIFVALIGFAAFTSCDRNNATPEETGQSAVKFTGNVANMSKTRAYNQTWEVGDQIGIFMVEYDENQNLRTIGNAANNRYQLDGDAETTSGNFLPFDAGNNIFYPMDGRNVNFIAYYPFNNGQAFGDYVITIPTDQNPTEEEPDTEVQPTFDLLYARAFSGDLDPASGDVINYNKAANESVAFQFEHKLSKVVINVNFLPESGDISNLESVTIDGVNTTWAFNLATGQFTEESQSNPAVITTRDINGSGSGSEIRSFDAIVLPIASGTTTGVFVKFNFRGEDTATWDWNDQNVIGNQVTEIESGKVYTFDVTIEGTYMSVSSSTITDWVEATIDPTEITVQ